MDWNNYTVEVQLRNLSSIWYGRIRKRSTYGNIHIATWLSETCLGASKRCTTQTAV